LVPRLRRVQPALRLRAQGEGSESRAGK
jgi:hypothetical protein